MILDMAVENKLLSSITDLMLTRHIISIFVEPMKRTIKFKLSDEWV